MRPWERLGRTRPPVVKLEVLSNRRKVELPRLLPEEARQRRAKPAILPACTAPALNFTGCANKPPSAQNASNTSSICPSAASLFAAPDTATGKVIGRCQAQHRRREFPRFLDRIERAVPGDKEIHLVLDNCATRKTPKVAARLQKRPRYHLRFTPASDSRLNQVERWFAKITGQRIRRGVFKNADELIAANDDYIAANNQNPKPFVWTATDGLILDRAARLCKRTNRSPH